MRDCGTDHAKGLSIPVTSRSRAPESATSLPLEFAFADAFENSETGFLRVRDRKRFELRR